MTKQTEALKLALELLDKQWQCTQVWSLEEAQDVADNIREALADQCVCGEPDTPGTHRTDGPCLAEPPARQRIDYRAECWPESPHYKPAQQQEPVAWMWRCRPYCDWPEWSVSLKRPADSGRDGHKRTEGYEDVPLYTSPMPSKPWVGLTQKDINIAFDDTQEGGGFDEFARAIEAKLREKNA